MIAPEKTSPTRWPIRISSDENQQLEHALENIVNDERWISDFIRRLNCAVEDMAHKK
jgi:hypothetical protein